MRLLQAVIVLAEELNFSRAADRLNESQPALSKQIDSLESLYRLKLFLRTHQKVQLTDAGSRFVEQAREAVRHAEKAIYVAAAAQDGVEDMIQIGRSNHADPFLVSALMTIRLPLFPTLKVKLFSNNSHHLVQDVLKGDLDLALVTGVPNHPKLSFQDVEDNPFYIALPADDELTNLCQLRLEEMHNREWIVVAKHVNSYLYDMIFREADRRGVSPADIHQVTSPEEAAHLIREYRGLAFLNRTGTWRIAQGQITTRPLDDARIRLMTKIAVLADSKSRLVNEFVKSAGLKLGRFRQPVQGNLPLAS